MSAARKTKTVAIVGAGPAGLAAAERLAGAGFAVTIHDRMPSAGRKFLLAGRGGLNLTHSEPMEPFRSRYGAAAGRLAAILDAYPPQTLRAWADDLGETTFVGSSGRVFPKSFKASPLLRGWLRRLDGLGVRLETRHRWTGFTAKGALVFDTPEGEREVAADAVVLALGGASWPRMGSDGGWVPILEGAGVAVRPLVPANCGFEIAWSDVFRERFAGTPLKRIAMSFGGRVVKGEAVITETGIEGQAVYALADALREAIAASGPAVFTLDPRPDVTVETLSARLAGAKRSDSLANQLRKAAGVTPVAVSLLREATSNAPPRDAQALAALVKALPLTVTAARPIDRAISTAGGIAWDEIGPDMQLTRLPGVFVAGEMIDWEAPTGGYLLQACFSTGVAAAEGIIARAASAPAKAPARPRSTPRSRTVKA